MSFARIQLRDPVLQSLQPALYGLSLPEVGPPIATIVKPIWLREVEP